ncbi:MAG: hypothetical protein HDQ99_03440 [Lachnospiraceae bacterium]|nr:hypothetical protein [Lachnospiraceae bacterium]
MAAQQRVVEERKKRRTGIQSQIQQWDMKLSRVNIQLSGLIAEQTNLNTYIGDWETQKNIYSGNQTLSDVVIKNIFEGMCADKTKDKFSAGITEMDWTCSKVSGLNESVSMQIARLNQYVSVINTKLTSLRNELDSI